MPFARRPDGQPVKELPLTRRIMPLIMKGRNESVVYFEQKIDMSHTQPFLEAFRERTGLRATVLHLLIWAIAQVLHKRPRLNRFVAGGRLYQREGIWVSFSAKKARTDQAPVVVIKKRIEPSWDFAEVVRQIEAGIGEGRSDKPSATDKELDLLLKLPLPLLRLLLWLQMKLDQAGLLPHLFYKHDPLYASVFIANLGSLNMDAGFHHLYEYGNIPIFVVVGRVKKEPACDERGEVVARPLMTLRYSFDERVEDGLYCLKALELLERILENPGEAGA